MNLVYSLAMPFLAIVSLKDGHCGKAVILLFLVFTAFFLVLHDAMDFFTYSCFEGSCLYSCLYNV